MAAAQQRSLGDRERFVAFAFAAADLLVEVGADGRITFAAGAFRARLGRTPDSLIGRDAGDVLAPEDRAAFQTALALLPPHGRLGPTAFRLADAARTVFSVSGLQLASAEAGPRLCLAFAPMPAPPELRASDGDVLLREATQQLRAGGQARLGLLEVKGVEGTEAEQRIDRLLGQPVNGAVAARLAPGRYGVVADEVGALPDLCGLAKQLESLLGPDGTPFSIVATPIDLAADGLTPAQAARALRHGLAAFARFGAEGLRDAGFADGLGGVVARVTARAAALRRTVAERRFRLDFQPIVDLETREIHHHEALMRLDPGVLEPGEGPQDFIALAETIGLTEDLDLAVASMAIAAANAVPEGRHLAFNISGLSTQSRAFRHRLLALLDRDPRGARRVMVELTESAEIEDEDSAAATLRALRARGVPVCIDDFGAGAAAFRYLKSFPTDYVKVDGTFVQAALTSERDRSFVAAMVDLSLAVGAKVVAERIETEEEAEIMRSLGVHFGQGWLFGRPGPL
ncbi:EAL domain-containing protein [Falsiroseomonas ponticola]|jgi:EAL domain-containing protein (putative c-di-GMP-specific phosphodiesterase class I)/PAS domain-containing protein|uniref:EAL domain-containing protein n=1 Tax=Falsiroseomonas ponticola TaxID=2786951 RepID=UPI0019316700|nr:EAL domain-containing protein [Roseomonas ponticola]